MNPFLKSVFLCVMFHSIASNASELDCQTSRNPNNTLTKVVSYSDRSSRYIKVSLVNASSGLEIPNFRHVFKIDSLKKESGFLKISGIKMVHTGDGINGLTNFDSLTLTVNSSTRLGSLLVEPTYNSKSWTLDFFCSTLIQ